MRVQLMISRGVCSAVEGGQRRSTNGDGHSLRDDVGVLEHKPHLRETGWRYHPHKHTSALPAVGKDGSISRGHARTRIPPRLPDSTGTMDSALQPESNEGMLLTRERCGVRSKGVSEGVSEGMVICTCKERASFLFVGR